MWRRMWAWLGGRKSESLFPLRCERCCMVVWLTETLIYETSEPGQTFCMVCRQLTFHNPVFFDPAKEQFRRLI